MTKIESGFDALRLLPVQAQMSAGLDALYARQPCPGTPDAPVDPAPDEPPTGWKRMDVQ